MEENLKKPAFEVLVTALEGWILEAEKRHTGAQNAYVKEAWLVALAMAELVDRCEGTDELRAKADQLVAKAEEGWFAFGVLPLVPEEMT